MIPTLTKNNIKNVKCESVSHIQLFVTPMDCSPSDSYVHGILQARILSGLSFFSPGDLPHPGIKPGSPAL